jgi:hypothetical protein
MFKKKKSGLTLLFLLVMTLVIALSSASLGLAQDQGGLTEAGGITAGETYTSQQERTRSGAQPQRRRPGSGAARGHLR